MTEWIQAAVAAVVALFQPAADPAVTTAGAASAQYAQSQSFALGLAAARNGDIGSAQAYAASASPIERQIIRWALIDVVEDRVGWGELSAARTDLAGWPRAETRQRATERALANAYASPSEVLSIFSGAEPTTADGAMALAQALTATGRSDEADALIRRWWRDYSFDSSTQDRFYSTYGSILTPTDHEARLNTLLYGPHGPATRAMLSRVSPDYRALAEARMAIRSGSDSPYVPGQFENDAGLALERARRARLSGQEWNGFQYLSRFPAAPTHSDGQDLMWTERRNYFIDALQARDYTSAYHAMAGHGFTSGDRAVDAEFFAGWVALTKLNNPAQAARHFEQLRQISSTPITQSRAFYWLGRAAEAQGDRAGADAYYRQGAQYTWAFYGQLAAERANMRTLRLPPEPQPTEADRARFESYPVVQAIRALASAGENTLVRVFVMDLDGQLTNATDYALLVDLSRAYGMQDLSMHVARTAAQRGFPLAERGYPVTYVPPVTGAPDPAFVHAIIRQESAFDPRVRSHANARGMMQLLPATASGVARRMGVPWRGAEALYEPDYNVELGTYHLGELASDFGGSYLLATIGYNAGPARPAQWMAYCGDPRGASTDPVDFIECAPFTETRNYMMRVMENMQVYRARLNDGQAEINLSQELSRGYSY
ncbi:lytic transglycosylase domain-containing protein [Brevundimonas aveniformis]|uniref:lytic transglycosylase domain-containing protein n=1 Tax=Brevundimonas aveniformis TaxID=370977 RepID=UPI0003F95D3A|nr:lytic transglycosylase domain-containing protein [Brevundimonas aveniformis]